MAHILGMVAGALLGAFVAMGRKGNRLDILHYAGVGALFGLILSLALRVVLLS